MPSLAQSLKQYLPSWLNDNDPISPSYGYRVLSTLSKFVDQSLSNAMGASLAAVGKGLPLALKYVGWARGVVRGRFDTDDQYATKLTTWIDRLKEAGSQLRLAKEIFDYLGTWEVRIVNRAGHWYVLHTDGSINEYFGVPFDWDSISNPERHDPSAPWWSDLFIIVVPTYPIRPLTMGDLTGIDDGFGLGQLVPRQEYDAVKEIVDRFKAAHSCVRAILWTSNSARYNPASPTMMPNGKWGNWGIYSSGHYIASDRDLTETRFWEPR